jgi:hypothetical protein
MQMIRIVAECPFFSIDEQVNEKKVVQRLEQIKKMFLSQAKTKKVKTGPYKWQYKTSPGKEGKLKVTTTVINPQFI